MSLPIAIAFNIVLCVLLLAALGWAMTRPRRLARTSLQAGAASPSSSRRSTSTTEQERRAA